MSQLSGRIVAAAGGRSLDDLNGRIQVTDARYRYNDKEIAAASMTVTGENSARSKLVELRSDFADATFRSKTSYREVFRYLRASAWKYLPLLRHGDEESVPRASGVAVANDYSLLSVDVRHIDPIADAVSPGLQVADGSSLQLLFNPASDQLSLKAASEYIERRRMLATRLSVNASNRGDSLAVYASAEDLYAGVLHLPRLSLTGGARQNRVQLSAGFDDTLRRVSGLVGFRAAVADEHGPNGRVVDLRILPSHITRGDKTWQIFARKILLDTAQVVIDKFYVMNREQELLRPLREHADFVIDTTLMPAAKLRNELYGLFGDKSARGKLSVNVVSFGFKYSVPLEADLVFDVRFLPNPFYVPELKHKTGMDSEVYDYVFSFPQTKTFIDKLEGMLSFLLPLYAEEGKSTLVIAVGCTGGHHRSVSVARCIASYLTALGYPAFENHRDITRG